MRKLHAVSIFLIIIMALGMTLPGFSLQSFSSEVSPENSNISLSQVQSENVVEPLALSSGQHPWSSVASAFPSLQLENSYSADAKVQVTADSKVRMMMKVKDHPGSIKSQLATMGIDFVRYQSSSNIVVVDMPAQQATFENAKQMNSVQYIVPDFAITADLVPSDPDYVSQWGPARIGMETAWEVQNTSDVLVAVLDSGVDYTHPDLADNYNPTGYDFFNNDPDPMDDNGHGTHVAGTIAASMNNGLGVAGMGNISIFAHKIMGSNGEGSYSIAIEAIYNATDMGADILSNSWGGDVDDPALQDAINYAVGNGALFIAAAGNSGSNVLHYPAAMDNVISVSSIDSDGTKSSFSNYGPTIDVAAPGGEIRSTYLNGQYANMSGTSMATPHVAGLAALIWAQYPTHTNSEVENILYNTAEDLGDPGRDDFYGYGLIDGAAVITGPAVLVDYSQPNVYHVGSDQNVLNWTFADTNPSNYTIYQDGIPIQNGNWTSDDPIAINIDGLDPGTYEFQIVVQDTDGYQNYHTVHIDVNDRPQLISYSQPDSYIYNTTGNELSWTFSDDGHPQSYTISSDLQVISQGNWTNNEPVHLNIDGLGIGIYNYQIVVTDDLGLNTTNTIQVDVINPAPQVTNVMFTGNFSEGTRGNEIVWQYSDSDPSFYEISVDSEIIDGDKLDSSGEVRYSLDDLDEGVYVIEIALFDSHSNLTTNAVVVEVFAPKETPNLIDAGDISLPVSFSPMIMAIVALPVIMKQLRSKSQNN